jgi:hypothetical protein
MTLREIVSFIVTIILCVIFCVVFLVFFAGIGIKEFFVGEKDGKSKLSNR